MGCSPPQGGKQPMNTHIWVALSYQPISIDVQPDGNLAVYTSTVDEDIAREDSVIICWFCHESLTLANYNKECPSQASPPEASSS